VALSTCRAGRAVVVGTLLAAAAGRPYVSGVPDDNPSPTSAPEAVSTEPSPAQTTVLVDPPPPTALVAAQVDATPAVPGPVVILVGLAAGFFVLGAMRASQDIIAPAVLALVIAIAISPMQSWLASRMPMWLAMIITILVTYTGLLAFVGAVGWSLYAFGTTITTYQDDLQALLEDTTAFLAGRGVERAQIDAVINNIDLGAAANVALNVAEGLYGAVTILAFSLTLLFFILIDSGSFGRRFAAIKRIRPAVAKSLSEFAVGVRRYLIVTTVFGAIVAAADVILLTILGVPLPLVWGMLAFLTGYIPTVGLIIGLIPPVLIALLANGWETALIVLIGYLLLNNVIQSFIQPKFIGDAVGLNIETSFFSLVLWGFVLGPLGALLAIPMSLMARAVLTDSDPRHVWLSIVTSDKAPPEGEIARLSAEVNGPPRGVVNA